MPESKSRLQSGLDVEQHIAELVDIFCDQLNQGQQVDLDEFAGQHPQLAEQLRPALLSAQSMQLLAARHSSRQGVMVFGDYVTQRLLGRGGMGEVYEARQISLGRLVAVKLLSPIDVASNIHASVDRFRNEARAAAALDHDHIVPVYHFEQLEDRYFIVMKLIDGTSWRERIATLHRSPDAEQVAAEENLSTETEPTQDEQATIEKRVPVDRHEFAANAEELVRPAWQEPVAHTRDVARALHHAHERGVIHRDVKPSNLLVDRHGKTWVSDFGLASFASADSLTLSGAIVGTVRYMSPERASGGRQVVDHRCDIYSLGATLYEMLTGKPAIDAATYPEQLQQLVAGDVVPLHKIRPDLPRDLFTIVNRMMAVDPGDRYLTAKDVADDLQRLLDGQPIVAHPISVAQRLVRWSRSRLPLVLSLFTLISLLLATSMGLLLLERSWRTREVAQNRELLAEKRATEAANSVADMQSQRASRAEQEAQVRLIDATMSLAKVISQSHEPGRQSRALELIGQCSAIARQQGRLSEYELPLRNLAIAAMSQLDIQLEHRSDIVSLEQPNCMVDPAFERVVCTERDESGQWVVSVRQLAPGMPAKKRLSLPPITPGNFYETLEYQFSPDGNFLAAGIPANTIVVWDLRTDQQVLAVNNVNIMGTYFSFSADSKKLAMIGYNPLTSTQGILIYNVADGQLHQEIPNAEVIGVQFLPSGDEIAVFNNRGYSIWRLADLRVVETWNTPAGDTFQCLTFSRDGKYLAAGFKKHILVWERAIADRPPIALYGHDSVVNRLAFHPLDPSILTSNSWDNTVRIWNVDNGAEQIMIPGSNSTWAADGSHFATSNYQEFTTYRVLPNAHYRHLHQPGFANQVYDAAFSHDGRLLATASHYGLQFRDARDHNILATLPFRHTSLVFSPENSSLVTAAHSGVFEWPILWQGSTLQIGPAKDIFPLKHDGLNRVSTNRAGEFIWNMSFQYAAYFQRAHDRQVRLITAPKLRSAVLSPNDYSVRMFSDKLEVWDEATNQLHHSLEKAGAESYASWSPDGKYLVHSNFGETVLLRVADWSEVLRVSEGQKVVSVGFNADSSLLAFPSRLGTILLYTLPEGKLLAEFNSPAASYLCRTVSLNPTGSRMVISRDVGGFESWDLAGLRVELATLGLDWDSPAYDPPSSTMLNKSDNDASHLPEVIVKQGEYEFFSHVRRMWREYKRSVDVATAANEPPNGARAITQTTELFLIATLCTQAIRKNPEYAWAYSMRAQANAAMKRYAAAVKDWEKAVELFPNPMWEDSLQMALETYHQVSATQDKDN